MLIINNLCKCPRDTVFVQPFQGWLKGYLNSVDFIHGQSHSSPSGLLNLQMVSDVETSIYRVSTSADKIVLKIIF